mmetsp:Transcript_46318/g.61316  ORF Transcript_46318/g.61316 Transcript_46318/m.61316 type:complete len:82 (+) Transcript_46318:60-305(+)
MVQADNSNDAQKCVVKHFAIDNEHAFIQYSLALAEDTFNALTGEENAQVNNSIGKNKILLQALDISGSMSGSPTTALKMGA